MGWVAFSRQSSACPRLFTYPLHCLQAATLTWAFPSSPERFAHLNTMFPVLCVAGSRPCVNFWAAASTRRFFLSLLPSSLAGPFPASPFEQLRRPKRSAGGRSALPCRDLEEARRLLPERARFSPSCPGGSQAPPQHKRAVVTNDTGWLRGGGD